ncbi:reverse transcriptase domain-containing protein [Tanacetum coccineum]
MRTRNSYFPNNSNVTILRRQNKGRAPNIVELELRTIVAPMAERTMEELLRAPTEGYGEAIVLPEINADHFEIKTNLLQLVQANPFYGRESENPHAHINSFKRITSTLRFRNVPNDVIKLMMFPYSLEGATKTWYEKEPPNSILTWEDLIVSKKVVTPAPVKAVEESCVTCGGAHSWYNCPATDNNQASVCVTTGTYNQVNPPNRVSNQMAPPGFAPVQNNGQNRPQFQIPTTPSPKKVVERETEETTDKEQTNFQGSTAQIPPPVIPISIPEPDVPNSLPKTIPTPESEISKSLPKPNIPYPSRRDDQKFAPTIKSLLMNKEKLLELAKIPLNENFSAMLLKKIPEKLGDPGKFLIPCNFPGMDVCHALADLGASINLMPLSIWKKLSLPELTPTRMTLELANRSITRPKGVAEDIFVKVRNFHFPTDFVVVDFEVDPRVPLILGRSFLRTSCALIDVYEGKLVLRDRNEPITFHVDGTSKHPQKHINESIKMVNDSCKDSFKRFTDEPTLVCSPSLENTNDEKEKQEVKNLAESTAKRQTRITPCLKNFKVIQKESIFHSNKTPQVSLIFAITFTLPFPCSKKERSIKTKKRILYDDPIDEAECFDPGGDNDEIDAFLAIEVPTYIEGYYDSEGDVTYLESLLSDDTTHNLYPEVFFDHEPQHIEKESDHVIFSPKSDPLHHEFTGELITIPPGIVREHEDYINRMSLLCSNSSSQSPENFHTIIESLPSSTTLIEDSDPNREEIDIFLDR